MWALELDCMVQLRDPQPNAEAFVKLKSKEKCAAIMHVKELFICMMLAHFSYGTIRAALLGERGMIASLTWASCVGGQAPHYYWPIPLLASWWIWSRWWSAGGRAAMSAFRMAAGSLACVAPFLAHPPSSISR